MHAFADGDGALIRRFLPPDHPEQRRLAGTVWADHADDTTRWQLEGEIVYQEAIAEALGEALEINHVLPKPLGYRDRDLRGLALLLAGQLQELLVALVPRLGLSLPCFRRSRDPLLLS